jgi:hypothetical protein
MGTRFSYISISDRAYRPRRTTRNVAGIVLATVLVRTVKEAIASTYSRILPQNLEVSEFRLVLQAISYANNSAPRHCGLSPFQIMLGRTPTDFFSMQFQDTSQIATDEDPINYYHELKAHLEVVRSVFQARSHELKSIRHDAEVSAQIDIPAGTNAIRVMYNDNNRTVLHEPVTVIEKVAGSQGTYEIMVNGERALCHAYQLCPVPPASHLRQGFEPIIQDNPTDFVTPSNDLLRALRRAPVGTLVANAYRGKIYIAETLTPYLGRGDIELLFYVPVGNNIFRRPRGSRERETNVYDEDVGNVIAVDIHLDPSGFCDPAQF